MDEIDSCKTSGDLGKLADIYVSSTDAAIKQRAEDAIVEVIGTLQALDIKDGDRLYEKFLRPLDALTDRDHLSSRILIKAIEALASKNYINFLERFVEREDLDNTTLEKLGTIFCENYRVSSASITLKKMQGDSKKRVGLALLKAIEEIINPKDEFEMLEKAGTLFDNAIAISNMIRNQFDFGDNETAIRVLILLDEANFFNIAAYPPDACELAALYKSAKNDKERGVIEKLFHNGITDYQNKNDTAILAGRKPSPPNKIEMLIENLEFLSDSMRRRAEHFLDEIRRLSPEALELVLKSRTEAVAPQVRQKLKR